MTVKQSIHMRLKRCQRVHLKLPHSFISHTNLYDAVQAAKV